MDNNNMFNAEIQNPQNAKLQSQKNNQVSNQHNFQQASCQTTQMPSQPNYQQPNSSYPQTANQQNIENVQKMNTNTVQQAEQTRLKNKAERFQTLGIGCFLYALFYTICLYHNTSGITYPFFAGGTLYFFGCFIKKLRSSSAEDSKDNSHNNDNSFNKNTHYAINKEFLMVSMLIAGALNCTTDSSVLLFFNKFLMLVLLAVLLLQCWHDITGWSIMAHVKGIVWMFMGSLTEIFTPISDLHAANRMKKSSQMEENIQERQARRHKMRSIAVGIVISIPIVIIITLLLASADVVFFHLISDMLSFDFELSEQIWNVIKILFETGIVFLMCYAFIIYNENLKNVKNIDNAAITQSSNWDAYIAATVNTIICIIYLIFSLIQIFGLFLGWMELPEGWTYASYARHGFFELVFICCFNIVLILFTLAYFEHTIFLRVVLTVICGCTYIMTVSSAYRMIMYIKSYHLTFLRVFVLWALLMIAIVMAGVIAYIYNIKFMLFRYILIVLTVGWLIFSIAHPDYWIASYNIATAEQGEELDIYYLNRRLSLDAYPALKTSGYQIENNTYSNSVKTYRKEISEFMGVRKFNLSRAYASYLIDKIE